LHFISLLLNTHCTDIILRDALDLTHRLEALQIDNSYSISTGDIESMYTNIDTEEILQAFDWIIVKDAAQQTPCIPKANTREFVRKCINFVCKNNYFTETTYRCFKQIFGIAMGSQLSKEAANLVAYWHESQRIPTPHQHLFRYVDDIIIITKNTHLNHPPLYPPHLKIM
jgi:hypothetical protein